MERVSTIEPSLSTELTPIGWREWVAFPSWGVAAMKAKIDTGARTSALHVVDDEPFIRDGRTWVRFVIHPWQRNDLDPQVVEALEVDEREITSSSGDKSIRRVVVTTIDLGAGPHDIELTLTRRDGMGFRMLLGREAMAGRYIVDPSASYLTGRAARGVRLRNRTRG